MSKITNLINKEEDILSSIDENKYLEKEVEIQHEHLHVEAKTKLEIRKRNVALTRKIYVVLATLAAIFFVGVLVYGVSFLPAFGADGNGLCGPVLHPAGLLCRNLPAPFRRRKRRDQPV